MLGRSIILAGRPTTLLAEADTRLVDSPLPILVDGQALMRTSILAMDPVTRVIAVADIGHAPPIEIGKPLRSFGAGTIVQSRSDRFPTGMRLSGFIDWSEYQIIDEASAVKPIPIAVSFEEALTLHDHTAMAAYFGMRDVGAVRSDETVLVTGSAGAVGSVASQIARIMGARVGGTASGPEKCGWLTKSLGLDFAIDYRHQNVAHSLSRLCPNGINLLFDNVGGTLQDQVVPYLAPNARIVSCGSSAHFLTSTPLAGLKPRTDLGGISVLSFNAMDYRAQFPRAAAAMSTWRAEGRLIFPHQVVNDLEHAPDALNMLFDGRSRGRLLVMLDRGESAVGGHQSANGGRT
jgi:NADPH-dependent curcumin reductase CurA